MARENDKNIPLGPYGKALPPRGWLNPYLHIAINGVLVTTSELLLKYGAMQTVQDEMPLLQDIFGVATLGSLWVWAGIGCYILAFFNWLYILRWVPLSVAFPLTGAVHVMIPLGSWLFLGEAVSPMRWIGIALIITGIWFIAEPLMKAEEDL
jgi:multidrug transporter EmrE-like cation transporter